MAATACAASASDCAPTRYFGAHRIKPNAGGTPLRIIALIRVGPSILVLDPEDRTRSRYGASRTDALPEATDPFRAKNGAPDGTPATVITMTAADSAILSNSPSSSR